LPFEARAFLGRAKFETAKNRDWFCDPKKVLAPGRFRMGIGARADLRSVDKYVNML
jgi:hypothetical protein